MEYTADHFIGVRLQPVVFNLIVMITKFKEALLKNLICIFDVPKGVTALLSIL